MLGQAKLCEGENHRGAGKTVPVPQGLRIMFWVLLGRFEIQRHFENAKCRGIGVISGME